MAQVAKILGEPLEESIGPPFPDRYAHLWEMFLHLHSGRSYSMGGPNPLSWSDIKAYDDLFGLSLKEWEVRAIKALDVLWLRIMNEARSND